MPSFSSSLEKVLHQALALASERHQEYATLEHLLLALIDDQDASAVMRACNVSIDVLRGNLIEYIDTELVNLSTGAEEESKPTAGFQRVIQRAVIHVQSSGREEVTGANVLVAIFAERESHAAFFPAGAGHDPLRRRQLHQPRYRQARRHVGEPAGARR